MKVVAIHLPVFKRKKCALMAYDTSERLRNEMLALGYDSYCVVGGSSDFDRELCRSYGHDFIMIPNHPVGQEVSPHRKEHRQAQEF